jgi:hypothetical protein
MRNVYLVRIYPIKQFFIAGVLLFIAYVIAAYTRPSRTLDLSHAAFLWALGAACFFAALGLIVSGCRAFAAWLRMIFWS